MNTVEKILDSIGLSSLGQTNSLIICRVFEAVQEYAMYRDKNPELEIECEQILSLIRSHLNQSVIR